MLAITSFALNEELNFLKWSIQSQESVFSTVQRVIEELSFPVTFPVEVRSLSADDIPLSMASERETGYCSPSL